MHADECRRIQNFSAAFFVQAVICLAPETLSPPILVVGTRSIVSETPSTNLQHSELVYPWETLDSWICFIEWYWPYDALYLVSIACI